MSWRRDAGGFVLLISGLAAAVSSSPYVVLGAGCLGLVVRPLVFRGHAAWASLIPVLLLAAVLGFLTWVSQGSIGWLPVKTLSVVLCVTAGVRSFQWPRLAARVHPHSPWWPLVLLLLVVFHFVEILRTETARVFRARRIRLSRPWGPGAYRSLVWVLVGVFERSWRRAERFYAAQRLRGLSA